MSYVCSPLVSRTVTVADTVVPAAPEDATWAATASQAGIGPSHDAFYLAVDVSSTGGAPAGTTTVTLLAWDRLLKLWVPDAAALSFAVPSAPFTAVRQKVTNWTGECLFPFVNTIYTGGITNLTVAVLASK